MLSSTKNILGKDAVLNGLIKNNVEAIFGYISLCYGVNSRAFQPPLYAMSYS